MKKSNLLNSIFLALFICGIFACDEGKWEKETVDKSDSGFSFMDIAVDSMDNLHISYFDYTEHDLKYATNASGIWETATLDNNGDVGREARLQ